MLKKFLAILLAVSMLVALWTVPTFAATLTKVFSADYRDASSCVDKTGNLDLQNQQANVVSSISYAKAGNTYYATSASMGNGAYRYMYQNGNYQTLNSVYTMEAYVYLSNIVQSETVELFTGGDSPFVKMFWKDGSFGFGYADDSTAVTDCQDRALSGSQWYHIVVTNDGTTCTLYVNGQAVGTSASIRVDGLWYFYLAHTAIDGYGVALYNIYNTAATASQVASLYTSCGGVLATPTKMPTPQPTEPRPTAIPGQTTNAFKTISENLPVFKAGDTVNIQFEITDIKAAGGLCGLDLTLEYNTALLSPGDTLSISSSSGAINNSSGSSDCKWWATGRISGKDTANPQIILTMLEDNGNYMVSEDGKIWISVAFTAIADSNDGDSLVNIVRACGTDSQFTRVEGIGTSVYAIEIVHEKDERSLIISQEPTKLIYNTGEKLNVSGMEAAIFVDGIEEPVDINQCVFEGFDSSKEGNCIVTVIYETNDAIYRKQFTVKIVDAKGISALGISAKPAKLHYVLGDELDLTGLIVWAQCNDGTIIYLDNSDLFVTGYDPNVSGIQVVTLSYGGYSKRFSVKVTESSILTEIRLVSKPLKLIYSRGEDLNIEGLSVLAVYADGTSTYLDNSDISVTGYDPNVSGIQVVTLSYGGYSRKFSVKVTESPILTGIKLVSKPSKLIYSLGENLDIEGLSVLAVYANGTSTYLNNSDLSVTGYDPNVSGIQIVTLSYGGYSRSFSIKVTDLSILTGIRLISKPLKVIYKVGEELDLTGLTVEAWYDDGTSVILTGEDVEVSGYDANVTGVQKVSVSYRGYFKTFSVKVV